MIFIRSMNQLYLFDTDIYDIQKRDGKLANLRSSIRLGWRPFTVDNVLKASKMYGLLCQTVFDTCERVIKYEQELSDNSESD